jgi:hypothetical protein
MAVQNLQWTGAGDGVTYTSAANWYDTLTAATALTGPAAGDSVSILSGNWLITAGLSPSGTIVNFTVGPQFTGSIGSNGTSLTTSISGTLIYNGRASLCNITAGGSNIAKAKILQTASQFNLSGGTWTQVEVGQSGNLYCTSSAVITTLLGTGGNAVLESGTAVTTTTWGGGRLQSARGLGTLITAGNGTIVNPTNTATITTATVGGGARLNIQSSGTITTLNALSGSTVDAQGSLYSFTVTNLNEHAGSKVFLNETVTVTATPVNIGMA